MKKIVVMIMLVICLSSVASAFVPVVIPAWYLGTVAVIAVTGAVAGANYAMRPALPPSVNALGDISRATAYAAIVAVGNMPTLFERNLTSKMTLAEVKAVVPMGSTEYPLVEQKIYGTDIKNPMSLTYQDTGLRNLQGSGLNLSKYTVVANPPWLGQCIFTNQQGVTASSITSTGGYVTRNTCTGAPCAGADTCESRRDTISFNTPTMPLRKDDFNPLQVQLNFGPSESMSDPLKVEIDRMYQDPDYVPTFTDDTTGLPFVPPGNVLSPSAAAASNAAMNAGAALILAEAAAADYAAQAATQAAAAAAALVTAQTELAADPSNIDKQKAVTTAAAASGAAIIVQAQAGTTAAQAAAAAAAAEATKTAAVAQTVAAIPALPDIKTVDFGPFLELMDIMAVTYPFNLPTSIGSYYSSFSGGEVVAPSFDLPMPLGHSIHVDLAAFNPIAVLVRYMIGILVTVGMLFYIIHFFRGIS